LTGVPADSKTFREFEKAARRRAGLPELGIPRAMGDVAELVALYALNEELHSRR
jgi:hypothetical protein